MQIPMNRCRTVKFQTVWNRTNFLRMSIDRFIRLDRRLYRRMQYVFYASDACSVQRMIISFREMASRFISCDMGFKIEYEPEEICKIPYLLMFHNTKSINKKTFLSCLYLFITIELNSMTLQNRPNEPNIRRKTRNTFREWKFILMSAWAFHFAASFAVILLGSMRYGDDRKYIPVDTQNLDGDCFKAYVNVLASSAAEEGGIICCTKETADGICGVVPSFLLFARRLTKLPEAWLLPLFPLLVRWAVQFTQGGSTNTTTTKRRFYLYIGLIQIRGWILYLFFDKIENFMVQPAGKQCWYDDVLKSYQAPCAGQVTDYSDHIVLFYAQILPIALAELLFSFMVPYWKKKSFLVPTILSTGLLYLYAIAFLAAYKTVAYYHTLFEIGVGYLISLLTQVPLFLIMSTSLMEPVRDYFFGIST